MGNKINPNGFRLGVTKGWNSRWYAGKKQYASLLKEDEQIRQLINKKLAAAGIARIEIERAGQQVNVIISAAKPGVVIGKGGESIKELRGDIERLVSAGTVAVNVAEIPNPNISAPQRLIPRARGSANIIKKRTSHITIIVAEKGNK